MCIFTFPWYKPKQAVPSAAGDRTAEKVTHRSQPRSVIYTPHIILCSFRVNGAGKG